MNTTELTPLTWAPHTIATVDTADGQATGFIGRAIAMRGPKDIEFVVLAKDNDTLQFLLESGIARCKEGLVLEPYKATLISSLRVAVVAHDGDLPEQLTADMQQEGSVIQAAHSEAEIVAVPLDAFLGQTSSPDRPLLNDPAPGAPASSNDVSDL